MERDPRLVLAVRAVMALLLFGLGALLLGLAIGVVAPTDSAARGPAWMTGIGGAVFLVSGFAVLFRHRPAAGWFAAMVMLACGAAMGLYLGLLADPASIAGGVPFISPEANARIGRVAFGLGGVACIALLCWGLWLGPRRQRAD